MAATDLDPLRTALEIPPVGETRRVQRGGMQIVVERRLRGLSVLAHDGQRARRFLVGVPDEGRLELVARPPGLPLRVAPREPVVLAPRGRLRGYLRVRLPFVLVWARAGMAAEPLVELVPHELDCTPEREFLEQSSAFELEWGARRGDGEAQVPVVLRNRQDRALQPLWLPLRLGEADLAVARQRIVARPRRLLFLGGESVEEQIRECAGRSR